jgi:hypothetical protein
VVRSMLNVYREARVPSLEEAGLGVWVRWRLHKIRPGASGGNHSGGGLNTDRVGVGQAGPICASGAVCLDQFARGSIYVERMPMLSIGVI